MSDEKPRRSRTAWPGPMSIAGVEPGHDHQLPSPLVQRVRLLTRAVVIFGVSLAAIGTLLVLIVLQRGEMRDRQQAELEREIRDSWCLALDTLPEGGYSLDRLRAQYDCGPGKPIADLPPDEQAHLAGRGRAAAIPPPPVTVQPPPPGLGAPAVPNPPRRPANEPPPRDAHPVVAPEPSPEPGPLVDLGPVTEPVCEALRVCG